MAAGQVTPSASCQCYGHVLAVQAPSRSLLGRELGAGGFGPARQHPQTKARLSAKVMESASAGEWRSSVPAENSIRWATTASPVRLPSSADFSASGRHATAHADIG